MAGEHIEDIRLELLKLNNAEVENKYSFMNGVKGKDGLKKVVEEAVAEEISENPRMQMQMEEEYRQVVRDRDELRQFILKNGEDMIHVPVNISRLILNCEQQFSLNKHRPTSLSPVYVLESVHRLLKELTVYPGRPLTPPLFSDANDNSTKLFKIYLRSELASKRLVAQERMT